MQQPNWLSIHPPGVGNASFLQGSFGQHSEGTAPKHNGLPLLLAAIGFYQRKPRLQDIHGGERQPEVNDEKIQVT